MEAPRPKFTNCNGLQTLYPFDPLRTLDVHSFAALSFCYFCMLHIGLNAFAFNFLLQMLLLVTSV